MVYFNFILYFNAKSKSVRAFTEVKLNSYIAILVSPKHKNPYYSSGVKGKFFTFIATVHIYIWLCTVAKSYKKKIFKKITLSRIKIIFAYFLFFIFFYSPSQTHSQALTSLCLTFSQTLSSSLSQTLTSDGGGCLSLIWVFGWVDHCGFCQLWMI